MPHQENVDGRADVDVFELRGRGAVADVPAARRHQHDDLLLADDLRLRACWRR